MWYLVAPLLQVLAAFILAVSLIVTCIIPIWRSSEKRHLCFSFFFQYPSITVPKCLSTVEVGISGFQSAAHFECFLKCTQMTGLSDNLWQGSHERHNPAEKFPPVQRKKRTSGAFHRVECSDNYSGRHG